MARTDTSRKSNVVPKVPSPTKPPIAIPIGEGKKMEASIPKSKTLKRLLG